MLNWELLRRPTNWLVIATMVILGLFALHFSLGLIHGCPAGGTQTADKHPSRFS